MAAAGSGKNIEEFLPGVKYNGLNTAKAVDFSNAASVALPAGTTLAGNSTITSASANALTVGPNGTTNPAFNVDASTASAATGLNITSKAAASGVDLSVISSGTNENLTINAKGSGTISIGNVSTGIVSVTPNLSTNGTLTSASTFTLASGVNPQTAGGAAFGRFGTSANSGPLLCIGTGAPTISATQGSLYIRTDGSSTSTRLYVNTNGTTGWTNVTTAT